MNIKLRVCFSIFNHGSENGGTIDLNSIYSRRSGTKRGLINFFSPIIHLFISN